MQRFFLLVAYFVVNGHCQSLLEVDFGESRSFQYSVTNTAIEECYITLPNGDEYELLPNATVIESIDDRYSVSGEDNTTTCGLSIVHTIFSDSGVYSLSITDTDNTTHEASYNLRVQNRTAIWPVGTLRLYAEKTAYIFLPNVEGTIANCYVTTPNHEELEITKNSAVSSDLRQWSENSDAWCGVEIQNVEQASHTGFWKLTAAVNGSHFYYNQVRIDVLDSSELTETSVTVFYPTVGTSFSQQVGHQSASYCQLTDPQGETGNLTVGQCVLNLETPTSQHAGTWVAASGVIGSPEEVIQEIEVEVTEIPYISASSSANEAISGAIDLYCKVYNVSSEICRFVSPNGEAISMTAGIGNAYYAPYRNGTEEHACGLTIRSPTTADYGVWTCFTGSKDDVRTGYITVSQDASTKVTTSESYTVYAVYDTTLTLRCSVQTSLDYCWFKHPNGSYYSAVPGATVENDLWTYNGDSLDVGSCGITFREVFYTESGEWTCNMGISGTVTDLSVPITVKVSSSELAVESTETNDDVTITTCAIKSDVKALSYCRFIRPDGVGINAANQDSDSKYSVVTNLAQGVCALRITNLAEIDAGTWTCAGRLQSGTSELSNTFDLTYTTISSGASTWGLSASLLVVTIFQAIRFI